MVRWYHGTKANNVSRVLNEGILKPGQPTKYRQDIPRGDAVYITTDPTTAEEYALTQVFDRKEGRYRYVPGRIFEVEVDESKLVPDEDSVFNILADETHPLYERTLRAWIKYSAGIYGHERPITKRQAIQRFQFLVTKNMEDPFTVELAENMKDLADYIVKNDPLHAKAIIGASGNAAHLGPLPIRRHVDRRPHLVFNSQHALEVRVRRHVRRRR